MRSDLGNLLKALRRLDEAKVILIDPKNGDGSAGECFMCSIRKFILPFEVTVGQ